MACLHQFTLYLIGEKFNMCVQVVMVVVNKNRFVLSNIFIKNGEIICASWRQTICLRAVLVQLRFPAIKSMNLNLVNMRSTTNAFYKIFWITANKFTLLQIVFQYESCKISSSSDCARLQQKTFLFFPLFRMTDLL